MKFIKTKYARVLFKSVSVVYFMLLAYVTFFSRRRGHEDWGFRNNANLYFMSKLYSYNDLDPKGKFYFIQDILGNTILFVPFVMSVTFLFPAKKTYRELFFLMLITTLFIESLQYIFNVGVFDIDDIVLNLVGGIVGMLLFNYIYTKYIV